MSGFRKLRWKVFLVVLSSLILPVGSIVFYIQPGHVLGRAWDCDVTGITI